MRERVFTVILTLGLLATVAQPASAVTTVGIVNYAFSRSTVRVAEGGHIEWHNNGSVAHTSTQNGSLSLWNTGNIAPGTSSSSVQLRAAGSYPYHCAIHTSMHGLIKVPIKVSPATGATSTTFTITLASASQTGYTYDVQRRIGIGPWKLWKSGVGTTAVTFKGMAGTYAFRSRLHKASNGATSGWSPARSIIVT